MVVACIIVGSLAAILGMAWGRYTTIKGLTIGADSRGRTPHKLGSGFYYVVPEGDYVRNYRTPPCA